MDLQTLMQMRVWPESVGFKAMMPWATEFKVLETKQVDGGADVIVEGLATSPGVDFCGDILPPSALTDDLPRYKGNALYTYCHNQVFPIGTTFDQEITEAGLRYKGRIVIADALPLSATAATLIDRGVVKRSSIGYDALEFKFITTEEGVRARLVEKARLHEIAAVPLGMNDATYVQATKSLGLEMGVPDDAEVVEAEAAEGDGETKELLLPDEEKRASGATNLPLASEETPWRWDRRAQDEILGDGKDWARYAKAHFWLDPDNAGSKAGYKLPFAKVIDGQLRAVWRGVASAAGAMLGARGGVKGIPEADRPGIWRRLEGYYKRFEKKVPEHKGVCVGPMMTEGQSLPPFSEITFQAGEKALLEELRLDDACHHAKSRLEGVGNIVTHRLGDGVPSDAGSGGVLSPHQVADVKAAHEHASAALKALGVGVLSRADVLELARMPTTDLRDALRNLAAR